jgi:hypothetical protein
MKKLTREAFGRARQFLIQKARPVERALFKHRFEGAPVEIVFSALADYQNQDGGFGHGLEPDLRTPSSSALATAIGLRMLAELGCPSGHPLVYKAVDYVLSTFDQEDGVWRVAPSDTNDHPHAPWWHDEDGSLKKLFDEFRIIPRALIVADLRHYSSLVPKGWLDEITEETVRYIEDVEILGEGGGSDLEYAVALAEAENLPAHYAKRLTSHIREAIPSVVVYDPEQWNTYCIKPLGIAPKPDALGADLIKDALQTHLDYKITHQTSQGTWDPTWAWGEDYQDVWLEAKREWQGILTLETLTQLKAFGRFRS